MTTTRTFVMCLALLWLLPGSSSAEFRKAAGADHYLLLKADGTVWGFGDCEVGQLALPSCQYTATPVKIDLPGIALDVAAARRTSFALLEGGRVYSWGSDDSGELGRGGTVPRGRNRPANPSPGAVAGLEHVVQIAASGASAAVVTEGGEVYVWGWLADDLVPAPRQVKGLPPIASVSVGPGMVAGRIHTLAVGRDGSLWAWGHNQHGQLGIGTTDQAMTPVRVDLPPVASAAAGRNFSVAVLADGTVRAWGGNDSSTMGNGKNMPADYAEPGARFLVPTVVAGVTGARSVVVGQGHVAVLLGDGTLRMWGHDGWGQTGVGTAGDYQMRPVKTRISGVTGVFMAGNRTFAVTEGGRLWFWGPGDRRLLGAMRQDKKVPTDISALW